MGIIPADFYKKDHENKLLYADYVHKSVISKILTKGRKDVNPRPHWEDGTPAHTLSINKEMVHFDASKPSHFPLITLRPIAYKSAIGELLWIYQDQSNNLDALKEKYGVTWWDEWEVGNTRTIGTCYGETVRRHRLMDRFLDGLAKDPDGRRHIINLWQVDDFDEPHGLKPCCYETLWNVRHEDDGDYLDMTLIQRSSDYIMASSINQFQYFVFMHIIAHCFDYKPGIFTWFGENIQVYDRHVEAANILMQRKSVFYSGEIKINPKVKDFYKITTKDIEVKGYPTETIKQTNPQIKLPIAI